MPKNQFNDVEVKDLQKASNNHKDTMDRSVLETMPDIQNGKYPASMSIQMVGIHGFKMPLLIARKDGGCMEVVATVTGTVSLEADKKGINMSRILRRFYAKKNQISVFDMDKLIDVLKDYKKNVGAYDAHIDISFLYEMEQDSLVSKDENGDPLRGYIFYPVVFDVNIDKHDNVSKVLKLDFTYSSACPCSTALSKHAALTEGLYGIPHSQRSIARCELLIDLGKRLWIEDLVEKLREILTTECQVIVKREDEREFALRNGADPKFVEDSIRRLGYCFENTPEVKDYKIIVSHNESLHHHNAIAVMLGGHSKYFTQDVSPEEYDALSR